MQSRCISKIPKFAVAITVSLMLAFMPFTVNLEKFRITLERNEALASPAVFAGAYSFLEEAATNAGFSSVGDFIATGVGITAATTGVSLGNSTGVNFGDSATDNLSGLIDSDQYPAWSTLSSSEQQSWVSQDNYNAAKYNQIICGMGLSNDYQQYQSTWGNFTPGEFSFSSSGLEKLGLIGEVGQALIDGYTKPLSAILSMFDRNDMKQAVNAYVGVSTFTEFDATNISNYPSGFPTRLYINQGDLCSITNTTYTAYATNQPVYWLIGTYVDTWNYAKIIAFSKENFMYGNTPVGSLPVVKPSTGNNAFTGTFEGQTYYYVDFQTSYYQSDSWNMTTNAMTKSQARSLTTVIPYILYGDLNFGGAEQITDYPEEQIQNNDISNINIYFPPNGINDTTDWTDLTTHVENIDGDLDGVIALLQHIDSDLHNLNIPGEPDLQPLINYLQAIDGHIQGLDFITSSDLQPYYTILQHIDSDLHKFTFLNGDTLKVHDGAVYTELENIYNVLVAIAQKMKNWGDISDAPDLIGDFDFDELENKVPDLLETISDLAPFGSILLLSEMYSILANYTQIESPELVFPFDFGGFDEQNHELVIDLSWLDDIKPLINFFCIALLIIAIANATIRIVEIEAAS